MTEGIRTSEDRPPGSGTAESPQDRFALALRGSRLGVWDWDFGSSRCHFSPIFEDLLGFSASELGDDPEDWLGRIHPEHVDRVRGELAAHVAGRTPMFESEHPILRRDGTFGTFLVRGTAERRGSGEALRLVGTLSEMSGRGSEDAGNLESAYLDLLTGLPNHALLMDRLTRAVHRRQRRKGDLFALLRLDVNRFKVVNESLGHAIGDEVLRELARKLTTILRPEDTASRFGGDQFTILLDRIDGVQEAIEVADRIRKELLAPFRVSGHELYLSVSIGITTSSAEHDSPEELVRHADMAMSRAKTLGHGHYEIYDTADFERRAGRLELETSLRRAVEKTELETYYQPIVDFRDGRIVGFEALVRWRHPERGLIAPDEFVPLAEETGLIVSIDEWVLNDACRRLRSWSDLFPDRPDLYVNVNTSGRQFSHPDLIGAVDRALFETGLDPRKLRLEITESVLMRDVEFAVAMLGLLAAMNVRIVIDDFGTGYTSFSYLHRFPISALKIDRSFVSRMEEDPKSAAIVRTITSLSRHLDLASVAEGVETPAELDRLRRFRCDYGQGYLFAKPLPAEGAEELLRQGGDFRSLVRGAARGRRRRSSDPAAA